MGSPAAMLKVTRRPEILAWAVASPAAVSQRLPPYLGKWKEQARCIYFLNPLYLPKPPTIQTGLLAVLKRQLNYPDSKKQAKIRSGCLRCF